MSGHAQEQRHEASTSISAVTLCSSLWCAQLRVLARKHLIGGMARSVFLSLLLALTQLISEQRFLALYVCHHARSE
jgi:hypothetical protein